MKPSTRIVAGHLPAFHEIIDLTATAQRRAFQAANTKLIELYWRAGRAKVSPTVTQMSFSPLQKLSPLVRQLL